MAFAFQNYRGNVIVLVSPHAQLLCIAKGDYYYENNP